MASFPSFLTLNPVAPLQTHPLRVNPLDLTPMIAQLAKSQAAAAKTGKGKGSSDGEFKPSGTVGNLEQYEQENARINNEESAGLAVLGAAFYDTPESRRLMADKARNDSEAQEKQRVRYVKDQDDYRKLTEKHGTNIHLENARKTGVFNINDAYAHNDIVGNLEHGYTPHLGGKRAPGQALAMNDIEKNPNLDTMDTATKKANELLAPAQQSLTSTDWGKVEGATLDGFRGVKHKTGGHSDNFYQVDQALQEVFDHLFEYDQVEVTDKKGNKSMQWQPTGKLTYDWSSPIFAGYYQAWTQRVMGMSPKEQSKYIDKDGNEKEEFNAGFAEFSMKNLRQASEKLMKPSDRYNETFNANEEWQQGGGGQQVVDMLTQAPIYEKTVLEHNEQDIHSAVDGKTMLAQVFGSYGAFLPETILQPLVKDGIFNAHTDANGNVTYSIPPQTDATMKTYLDKVTAHENSTKAIICKDMADKGESETAIVAAEKKVTEGYDNAYKAAALGNTVKDVNAYTIKENYIASSSNFSVYTSGITNKLFSNGDFTNYGNLPIGLGNDAFSSAGMDKGWTVAKDAQGQTILGVGVKAINFTTADDGSPLFGGTGVANYGPKGTMLYRYNTNEVKSLYNNAATHNDVQSLTHTGGDIYKEIVVTSPKARSREALVKLVSEQFPTYSAEAPYKPQEAAAKKAASRLQSEGITEGRLNFAGGGQYTQDAMSDEELSKRMTKLGLDDTQKQSVLLSRSKSSTQALQDLTDYVALNDEVGGAVQKKKADGTNKTNAEMKSEYFQSKANLRYNVVTKPTTKDGDFDPTWLESTNGKIVEVRDDKGIPTGEYQFEAPMKVNITGRVTEDVAKDPRASANMRNLRLQQIADALKTKAGTPNETATKDKYGNRSLNKNLVIKNGKGVTAP